MYTWDSHCSGHLGTSRVMHKRFLCISFTDLLSPNVHWAVSERVKPDRNSRTTYEYKDYSISMCYNTVPALEIVCCILLLKLHEATIMN